MIRRGIISCGNWLIDYVKVIDSWSDGGNLSTIRGVCGNVLIGLSRLETGLSHGPATLSATMPMAILSSIDEKILSKTDKKLPISIPHLNRYYNF